MGVLLRAHALSRRWPPGAFFGAGAYTTALLDGAGWPWPLPVWPARGAAAAHGAGWSASLALRLRGPYFAVFTFGLAELAKHVLIWYETSVTGTVGRLMLTPPGADHPVLHGARGGRARRRRPRSRLRRSRWGQALVGIGADEERAETLGIDTARVKIGTFALSAAFMGAVGAAMAPRWTYLDPQVFSPLVSFQTVIMALLGGAANRAGARSWAPCSWGWPPRCCSCGSATSTMLGLGLTLIVVVLLRPQGLP